MLVNEYDRRRKFYRQFPAEKQIRFLAEMRPNSYNVGVFASCRDAERFVYGYVSREIVNSYFEAEAKDALGDAISLVKKFVRYAAYDSDEDDQEDNKQEDGNSSNRGELIDLEVLEIEEALGQRRDLDVVETYA